MFGKAPSGHSAEAAASRTPGGANQRMNPAPTFNVLRHNLARMLPLHIYQKQVYRFAEKFPPGLEDGYAPIWEVVTFPFNARQTLQARVNVQREWHLISVAGSATSNANGGFRVQLYDMKKTYWGKSKPGVRLADRGISFANYTGAGSSPFFLREPYPLTEPNAQLLVICQNLETVSNTVQIALYGVARRFNFPN